MRSALVMCAADPATDPRPNRMIRCLARDFSVHVIARGDPGVPGVHSESIPLLPARSVWQKFARAVRQLRGRYRHIVWTPGLRQIAARHRGRHDFIAVHDLRLLPVALAIRGRRGVVLFDAREYYPRHYEDLWWWRLLYQRMNRDLCRRFMPRANHTVTVSAGLAAEYEREFGIRCTVLPGLPPYRPLAPRPVDENNIRLIHHGLASRSRQLEKMIQMMDHLPARFSLDLMLVPSDPAYLRELQQQCVRRRQVRIIPPVPFAEIVPASNAYDVGVFLVPPVSFNLRFALPNKFFEFIQARLMVAIGPSPDMARYVQEHDLGLVAADFQPATLAAALAKLTAGDIWRFKQNANRAAAKLNSEQTEAYVRALARGEPNAVPAR